MKYIDVSEHQGIINWNKVLGNVDGVMIRAGYGRETIDKQFVRNVTECNRLQIPCGAYWFSYAYTPDMAKREATQLLGAVLPYRMELPLAFDFEYDSVSNAEKNGVTITKDLASAIAYAFCDTIESKGYYVLNYANPDYLNRYFDSRITDRFGLWLAQWTLLPNPTKPPKQCSIWQYSNKGKITGIDTKVDLNESYSDFAELISKLRLNQLESAAVRWAKRQGLIKDVNELRNPENIVEILYKIYGQSDAKSESELIAEE